MGTFVPPTRESAPNRVLVEELTPFPDPWEVACKLAYRPHLLFLDSADQSSPRHGRYSYVTASPFCWIASWGRNIRIDMEESTHAEWGDPFDVLAQYLGNFSCSPKKGLPPFQGGAAGLFGYGLAHHLEMIPRPRWDEFQTQDLGVGLYDWVISFDHLEKRSWIITTGLPHLEPSCQIHRANGRLREILKDLQSSSPREERVPSHSHSEPLSLPLLCPQYPVQGFSGLFSNFSRPDYLKAVERVIDYLHSGDCFQVNLSQRLLSRVPSSSLDLYGRLRERNPAPFAAYLDLGDFAIASASPERFLKVEEALIETYPIKGTRPRGKTPVEDHANIEDLLHSAKDRAENVMIVDLLRNDLGRVCRYGSVQVPAVCQVETFPFVHHLISEVHGQLRGGLTPIDLLRAAFPGGSVTGAPKIRAMEIIAELEPTVRGPYCGSLGFIGFDGAMDMNILIRTFTIGRGWAQFPMGGGIVADSNPSQEYEETWHKAEGLVRALN